MGYIQLAGRRYKKGRTIGGMVMRVRKKGYNREL